VLCALLCTGCSLPQRRKGPKEMRLGSASKPLQILCLSARNLVAEDFPSGHGQDNKNAGQQSQCEYFHCAPSRVRLNSLPRGARNVPE
jgi:hypothetical protein